MIIKNLTLKKKIGLVLIFVIPLITLILTLLTDKHYDIIILSSIMLLVGLLNILKKTKNLKIIDLIIYVIWIVLLIYFYIKNYSFFYDGTFFKLKLNEQIYWFSFFCLPICYTSSFIILND